MKKSIILNQISKKYKIDHQRPKFFSIRHKKEYFWALKDISFEVLGGESFGLIGNNGSGKTTLLRIIAGITTPTSGSFKVNGSVSAMLSVGVGFNNELTGLENIYLNGAILGLSKRKIDIELDNIISFSEIEDFIDTPVKRYSSGMRVRLGFSIATQLSPNILLIDEVLSVGDVGFRQKALNRLNQMAKFEGRTLIFVSHNMAAVKNFCNKVIWLEKGKVRELGDADDIIQNYLRTIHIAPVKNSNDHLRHEGNQKVQIKHIELLNHSGKISNTFLHDSSITFRIHYYSTEKIQTPVFSLTIIGLENNTKVARFHSIFDGTSINSIDGEGQIEIQVPKIPWMPGNYRFVASIESLEKEIFDRVRGFPTFSIIPSTLLLKSKYVFDQTHMAVYTPSQWIVNNE